MGIIIEKAIKLDKVIIVKEEVLIKEQKEDIVKTPKKGSKKKE